jgi:hypothetical protein
MPYAIFSKRTKVVNRIVDDLSSLLPSESMIEVDAGIRYPRGYKSIVEGQKVNTFGFPMFLTSDGTPTISPQYIDYDPVTGRPYAVTNKPIYEQPTVPGGERKTIWNDISIIAHPFVWNAYEVAALKYESILARNYPFQVAIGEEFITDEHINTGASDNYVLSEGKCYIAPGGVLQTDEFQFFVNTQGLIAPLGVSDDDNRQYVFDTYFLDMEPDPPFGVKVEWTARSWDTGNLLGTWHPATTNDQTPTTEVGASTSTVCMGIILRVTNQTADLYALENYLLMLRIRKLPTY